MKHDELPDGKASTDSMHHRAHDVLRDYWEKLRGMREFPQENEIEPEEIQDIWDSCFLVSIDDVTKRVGYRYSYLGTELVKAFGDDIDNPEVALRLLSMSQVPNAKKIDEVIEKKQPVVDDGEFLNKFQMRVRYRTCIVPFGYDKKVTHILGVMRWRLY